MEVEHPSMPLLVHGSIIAWDGYKGPDGQSAKWVQHYRFIEWHGQDWRRLRQDYPGHVLITGGDYNQNRDGARWYGTPKGRGLLTGALQAAGLTCVTEEDFVKTGKLKDRHTVDHLCVDDRLVSRVTAVGAWERKRPDGLRMSDHSGVWLEAALA